MTYPTQPGQPGGWSDPSWPSPEGYQDPAAQASPAGYDPYSAPPGYGQPPGYPPPPGYAQPPGYAAPQPYGAFAPRPTNGMAVAALVCSLVGLVTCGITSLIGAILGHVARKQIAERGENGDGMALAGIIVGWIVFGLGMLGTLLYVGVFAMLLSVGDSASSTDYGNDWGDLLRLVLAVAR
ncbi:MAG: DUF4190 domain-containing protein [Dactylosporangium sp.]|nr:DUF4190 domain-containing protein [Dactylosporangium sp.]NNJ62612.1 DUF4190 domain-containing protein [Dactylosporangium sp.]